MDNNDMNRNEKFEVKKQIVRDMTKNGAKVMDMADRLKMGEAEMYAFLSRNFGGVRKLRESMGMPRDIKQVEYVLAAEAAEKEPKLLKVDKDNKLNFGIIKPNSGDNKPNFGDNKPNFGEKKPNFGDNSNYAKSTVLSDIIQSQRERLMNEFRETIKADMVKIFEEVKEEVVEGFKQDLVDELSNI